MWIARIKIALFGLFLAAPVVVLLLFGPADSYGQPQTRFPAVGKVLLGKKGRFDQFGDAVLERSDVRRLAIQLKNWAAYRVVGYVDNDNVVSGKDGWLFYRADFNSGRCLDEDMAAQWLRQFAALIDLARAAGIEMFVSMSPDKSAVYPEMLSPIMRGSWKCRIENIAALRRVIKREIPTLIDHTDALLAEKARHPDVPLYFPTDTHWTPYGGAIALRQLVTALYPGVQVPPPRMSGLDTRQMDLLRLLLLRVFEPFDNVEPLLEKDLGSGFTDRPAPSTLIVHDSFYGRIRSQLTDLFPRATVLRSIGGDGDLGAQAMAADRLIINLVERTLLVRIEKDLNWDTSIARMIVTRNMQRAQDCRAFEAVDDDGLGDGTRDVAIGDVGQGQLPCLRLSVTAKKRATLKIALPDPEAGAFESRRTLEYRVAPGALTIAFVLPGYIAGSNIRVSLDHDAAVSAMEVGEIPQPSPPGGAGTSDQP